MHTLLRYIIAIAIMVSGTKCLARDANAYRDGHQQLYEVFEATVDSFRNCFISGRLKTAHLWIDAAYRSVCDSDTYYAYKGVESYVRIADGSIVGLKDDITSVIRHFNDRSDTFGIRMLSTAYSSLGNYMLVTDYEKAITYYDIAIVMADRIGDMDFKTYNKILKSEAYQRANKNVEAAIYSREVIDSKIGGQSQILRFMAQTQLYKIYTKIRANSMVEHYGEMIESEGYYNTSLTLEARYLLRKTDYLIATEQYKAAHECSTRLLQTCELTGTGMEIWRVHLQAAKVLAAIGEYNEAQKHVDICKKDAIYVQGHKYTSLYSSYHVDLVEAWIALERQQIGNALRILNESKPPQTLLDDVEYGLSYYRCKELIYSRMGDYKNAVKMVDKSNKLREQSYEMNARQRAVDLDNIYRNDTTLLNQDVVLARKSQDLSSAQNRIIIGILMLVMLVLIFIVVKSAITRYKRREEERRDIEKRKNLENEITRQTKQLRTQKDEISKRNLDIMLSQSYARVIQKGVLPDPAELNFKEFSGTFVIYKPVDVVSGDFYWFRRFGNNIVICCADCSGYGVPGAMMTMIGLTLLSDITRNRTTYVASELLEDLDVALLNMMPDIRRSDAMNVSMVIVDTENHKLNIALAHQNMILKIGNDMIHVTGDTRRVGFVGKQDKFTDAFYDYSKGDSFYLYTDGVYALPGGVYGDKLTPKRFMEIITKSLSESIENRDTKIMHDLAVWLDGNDQADDYSIVGIEL